MLVTPPCTDATLGYWSFTDPRICLLGARLCATQVRVDPLLIAVSVFVAPACDIDAPLRSFFVDRRLCVCGTYLPVTLMRRLDPSSLIAFCVILAPTYLYH